MQSEDTQTKYGLAHYSPGWRDDREQLFAAHNQDRHVAVTDDTLAEFAIDNHLPIALVWEVVRGERLEVDGWRAWTNQRWSASKPYQDPWIEQEKREDRARLEAEGRVTAARVARINEQRLQAEQARREDFPRFKDYSKKDR